MSEQRELLCESAARLFEAHANAIPSASGWHQQLWDEADALGIIDLLVPEAGGGTGADWDDACAVLQASGRQQIPLPLAEAMIARRLIADAKLRQQPSTVSLAVKPVGTLGQTEQSWQFSGTLRSVPWGRYVDHVVTSMTIEGRRHVVVVAVRDATVHERTNLAGEPRDDLSFASAAAQAAPVDSREVRHLFAYAALARAAQIAGALECALDRSIAYALERKQFGRAIGHFQAIQQQLALFGAETAASACASRSAAIAACASNALFEIAAAKLRVNQAIGTATAIAHQVHGAIGFTQEYALHHVTQRLWSWRSEYGNDRYWSEQLGRTVIERGADNFWNDLVSGR